MTTLSILLSFPESTLKNHSDHPSSVGLLLASTFSLITSIIGTMIFKQCLLDLADEEDFVGLHVNPLIFPIKP